MRHLQRPAAGSGAGGDGERASVGDAGWGWKAGEVGSDPEAKRFITVVKVCSAYMCGGGACAGCE